MEGLNFEQLHMEPLKFMRFKEFLDFQLNSNKPLSFLDFQKHCGISRKQWEIFKFNNREIISDVEWLME